MRKILPKLKYIIIPAFLEINFLKNYEFNISVLDYIEIQYIFLISNQQYGKKCLYRKGNLYK